MKVLQQFYEIFEENNYKVTEQRKLLFEAFLENREKHMTVEEVHGYIIKKDPGIGIATVYRSIQLLYELKILQKLILDDGTRRYELNISEGNSIHYHLICRECGEIIESYELRDDLLESMKKIFDEDYGFLVSGQQINFFGLCEKCRDIK
ncbi:Fur family transcriptional regulator [Senegalia sp. (in: firmicutes)]|uniref:Fur family transcriptional regulator n=1 Tax=Senegalia sp. (in: firmicutes) TaxID=1924098 RepID=UPI003F996860